MLQIKVCGLKTEENARAVLRIGPDYVGFIFVGRSPRWVGPPDVCDWIGRLPDSTRKVGVFVNAETAEIRRQAQATGLSVIQLHGDEPPEQCRSLRAAGWEVWKVFSVGSTLDLGQVERYAGSCDRFLFDTGGRERGGNGIPFDWTLLHGYSGETPYWLSGGIGPEAAPAIRAFLMRAPAPLRQACIGVDINSRFETAPGNKDVSSIKQFQDALKRI